MIYTHVLNRGGLARGLGRGGCFNFGWGRGDSLFFCWGGLLRNRVASIGGCSTEAGVGVGCCGGRVDRGNHFNPATSHPGRHQQAAGQ